MSIQKHNLEVLEEGENIVDRKVEGLQQILRSADIVFGVNEAPRRKSNISVFF